MGIVLEDGSDRVHSEIVRREFDSSGHTVKVTLHLECGHKVTKPIGRVPRGNYLYCKTCREKNRAS